MKMDKRDLKRINFASSALVRTKSKEAMIGNIRDVASNSLYLCMDPVYEMGEQVDLDIVVVGKDSQLTMKTSAVTVRKDDQGVAFRFHDTLEWWPILPFFHQYGFDR